MQRIYRRHRQKGGFMLEMMLAVSVLSLAAYAKMRDDVEATRLSFAAVQGDGINILSSAANKYTQEQFGKLQSGESVVSNGVTLVHGFLPGQSFRPTVANLIDMGYLERPFATQSRFSNGAVAGNYQIEIERSPAGCETTSPLICDVIGKVYIDRPITAANGVEPDGAAIGAIMRKLGGFGGFSMLPNGATVRFPDGSTIPNPVAGNPAGVVVAKFGYGSSGLSQFVRLNDTRDPNLQGSLTVKNQIKGDEFYTDSKVLGAECKVNNAVATSEAGMMICHNLTWHSIAAQAAPGSTCSPDGKAATSTVNGEQLLCKKGVFVKSTSLMAKNVLVSRVLVKDGDTVNKPVCDVGGVADRSFTLTQTSVDVTTAPPKQSMYAGTQDLGTSWRVLIKLRTDSGTEVSANTHSVTAVVNLECMY